METLFNTKEELRRTFIWRDEWVPLAEGLRGIRAGDIFYMREPGGDEIVADGDGRAVFVATGDSYMHEERYTVTCVPVADGVIELPEHASEPE